MGTLLAIVRFLPIIIELVRSLEVAFTEEIAGETKAAIAKEVLEATYEETPDVAGNLPRDRWLSLCLSIVSRIVKVFNAVGIFRTKGQVVMNGEVDIDASITATAARPR